ncbi:hypothetical protein Rhe02_69270 [Rhizocola hellebori]|uniref:Lipoprotein n=2 Tax=Rhizocola hellebori TaxID=1392758 RepID=A0A8J3VJM8_9ACTN|nr:hypothetical protein Rhe02_69270 [Rhizocola hellebori]
MVLPGQLRTAVPAEATLVAAGATAAEVALATSRVLFRRAPAVVLLGEENQAELPKAAESAIRMGVPLLLTPSAGDGGPLRTELVRLQTGSLVTIGAQAAKWAQVSPSASAAPPSIFDAALRDIKPDPPLNRVLVLAVDDALSKAALATVRASGARILTMTQFDPRAEAPAIKALAGQPVDHVLGLGSAFGPPERLRQRVDTAAGGILLPAGGQVLFPGRRMVALYGHPGDTKLGSLGEQGVPEAVARAKKVAAGYASLVKEPVVPAFEIIATVASGGAGPDGDYSSESSLAHLRPWVDAAGAAGMYVVLDLQPGLTDFLTQAKRYTELLALPHVGLALDPEWRLKPGQRHMEQIGSVSAGEVNATSAWLAQLTRERKLPQKLLMLHQFRLDMITNRSTLDTSHDELQVVIHADGFGSRGQKLETWRFLRVSPPPNVRWGWKNFYDEDTPTFTPAQTVELNPSPVFISYQ